MTANETNEGKNMTTRDEAIAAIRRAAKWIEYYSWVGSHDEPRDHGDRLAARDLLKIADELADPAYSPYAERGN